MFFFKILHGFYNKFVKFQRILAYISKTKINFVSFNIRDYKLIRKIYS